MPSRVHVSRSRPRRLELEPVVLVVAGHVDHVLPGLSRVQRREAAEPEVVVFQPRAVVVGPDVAGEHEDVRARRGLGGEIGMTLEMQVGEELDVHAARQRLSGRRGSAVPTSCRRPSRSSPSGAAVLLRNSRSMRSSRRGTPRASRRLQSSGRPDRGVGCTYTDDPFVAAGRLEVIGFRGLWMLVRNVPTAAPFPVDHRIPNGAIE